MPSPSSSSSRGRSQAHRAVGRGGLASLEHLLDARPHALRHLGRRRGATVFARAPRPRAPAYRGFLQVTRDADRPALVAEVALELRRGSSGRRSSRTRSRGTGRTGRSPSAGRGWRPGSGRPAARRRVDSAARAGARGAGSDPPAGCEPAGRRYGRAAAARSARVAPPENRSQRWWLERCSSRGRVVRPDASKPFKMRMDRPG